MSDPFKRRFECPFGCAKGFTEQELALHLWRRHSAQAVARKVVELLNRLREYEL